MLFDIVPLSIERAFMTDLHAPLEASTSPEGRSATSRLDTWLSALISRGGSDLLLIAGASPSIRREGKVEPIVSESLSGAEIEAAVVPALIPRALAQYRNENISDSSYRVPGVGRFRINLHREKGNAAA